MDKLYVLIKVEPGWIEGILDSVLQKRYVKEASAVTGSYDIIVKIEGASIAEILSTVVREIHKIEGIKSTETLVAVEL
ncbi:MAG: Lrp/AsnC ligand binding domain-containing protein [Methanomassiliicoccales archaeon]|nr:MAG: Lrp/AsnC ligand binding domain-containing protein [Methanomassiliicoccales archaeon]